MVLCFVKTALCLYLSCSVVVSYQANRELPYYRDRTNSNYATSKYSGQRPLFNKVMTRIDNMNDQVNGKWSQHKMRHKSWNQFTTTSTTTTTTEAGLFETYGDLEEEDYVDSYEDNLEDEDDNFDYEDDDTFENTFEDIQAEEPTEPPSRVVRPPARPVSVMTEQKWLNYGTRDRVEESRRQQLHLGPSKEQLKLQAAIDHYTRILHQSKCQNPLPKVIPVQQEYPDPSKAYTPHCTVLHRCADDTGCCKSNTKCQYKNREIVSLYFYVAQSGLSQAKVEKLAFYNHTECECRELNLLTTESSVGSDLTYKVSVGVQATTNSPREERCKCPKEFKAIKSTSKCSCDCETTNEDCVQLKKGKEHFSMTNRICLQEGRCGLPICEYGSYSLEEGKCPTKKDKFEEFSKINIYSK